MIWHFTNLILLNESTPFIGPEVWKLIYLLLIILVGLALFIFPQKRKKIKSTDKQPLFKFKRIEFTIVKEPKYNPDNLILILKNRGNFDVDIDRPLLIFDNFWFKKKFKLKGSGGYEFYPLVLEKGKTHTHTVNLAKFYTLYDKLTNYPKVKICIYELNGKFLTSRSVYLRKILIPF